MGESYQHQGILPTEAIDSLMLLKSQYELL